MAMMSAKEASSAWGISPRRITALCSAGKISGAKKANRIWQIPADAEKPADARLRSGSYRKSAVSTPLPLPVGISDYRLASTKYYYVDKTLMIRDFLDQRPMVSLFTRPRRFGKTLNMDMLRVFFEKTDEDTSVYFTNKAIWACGQRYRDYQGKYPVIFLTFKDVKRNTWEETYAHLTRLIAEEYMRHSDLATSSACNDFEKATYQRIVSGTADSTDYISSLKTLSSMLCKHYGCPAIIIIDEYDTPILQGHLMGFYADMVSFMNGLFSGGLKDNRSLAFGFLTGILCVTNESILSGLNNLVVNSILDKNTVLTSDSRPMKSPRWLLTITPTTNSMSCVIGMTAIVSVIRKSTILGPSSTILMPDVKHAHIGFLPAIMILSRKFLNRLVRIFIPN